MLKVCNLKSNHLKIESKTINFEKYLQEEKRKISHKDKMCILIKDTNSFTINH